MAGHPGHIQVKLKYQGNYIKVKVTWVKCAFWLIWFINQRALYNHALSVIGVIGVGIIIICAHLPLVQGQTQKLHIWYTHAHMSPIMHIKYLGILTCSFQMAAILVFFFNLLSCLHRQSQTLYIYYEYVDMPQLCADYIFGYSDLQFSNGSHFSTFL